MARSRILKPSLFVNEILGEADPLLTILFAGLWTLADREGRLEDRPLRIKVHVFPYRVIEDFDGMLDWLAENGFIVRYEVEGQRYIEILKFVEHQNLHKQEADSKIPAFSTTYEKSEKIGSGSEKIGSGSEKIGTAPAITYNPITVTCNPSSEGPPPEAAEEDALPQTRKPPASTRPPYQPKPDRRDVDAWLAVIAVATGAKGVRSLAERSKWESAVTKALHAELDIGVFERALKQEYARPPNELRFVTPEKILQVAYGLRTKQQEKKGGFIH
ncbi:MAG: hypothetical protein KF855_03310 [Acidobacteria bacterium]|nr:hypothetical protein [Acidobacteriota bacterium]